MRKRLLIAASARRCSSPSGSPPPRAGPTAAAPANPGFEQDGAATGSPSGWRATGDRAADFTEAGGHSGGFRLCTGAPSRYKVETTQQVTRPRGRLVHAARLGAGERRRQRELDRARGLRPATRRARPCRSRPRSWLQIVVSTRVDACAPARSCSAPMRPPASGRTSTTSSSSPAARRLSLLGADVSSLAKSEDKGGVYRDVLRPAGRRARHPRGRGPELVRLRVWVDPADGYHDKAELLELARRARRRA